jgi:hypothetical protein
MQCLVCDDDELIRAHDLHVVVSNEQRRRFARAIIVHDDEEAVLKSRIPHVIDDVSGGTAALSYLKGTHARTRPSPPLCLPRGLLVA